MLGDKVKELRKQHKITQTDLAEAIGLSQSTIGMMEKGKQGASRKTLLKLADFFGVTVDYLLDDDKKPKEEKIDKPAKENSPVILEQFTDPKAAMQFILKQPAFMAYGGYDLNEMSDEEILEIANDMLLAMKISIERRKDKKD